MENMNQGILVNSSSVEQAIKHIKTVALNSYHPNEINFKRKANAFSITTKSNEVVVNIEFGQEYVRFHVQKGFIAGLKYEIQSLLSHYGLKSTYFLPKNI